VPLFDAATEVMEQFLAYLAEHHPDLVAAVAPESRVVEGVPGPRILEIADEIDASLIVIGSHGRSGLSGLILGSKAEEVIRGAKSPVTVVKDRIEWR
jgi:nucleotide-binding universal stress UspA family protein